MHLPQDVLCSHYYLKPYHSGTSYIIMPILYLGQNISQYGDPPKPMSELQNFIPGRPRSIILHIESITWNAKWQVAWDVPLVLIYVSFSAGKVPWWYLYPEITNRHRDVRKGRRSVWTFSGLFCEGNESDVGLICTVSKTGNML